MNRCIKPELLDLLPPVHPLAAGSRADLKRVNAWMANATLIASEINGLPNPPRRWLELGAGDGSLLLNVLGQTRFQPSREITLLDQQNLMTEETRALYARFGVSVEMRAQNVLDWAKGTESEDYDAIVCNLFLHHFHEPELKLIFAKAARCTRFFVACEPRRSRAAVIATQFLWIIGCNPVTRHDAEVSVRAGFSGKDLEVLWPDSGDWILRESSGGFASHVFAARRSAPER